MRSLPDTAIARALWDAANAAGASDIATLALFEAAIVESGMSNPKGGPDGSLGVLQQRPSWGSVESRLNPTESANRFLAKARGFEPWKGSAGSLAQKIQVSAFPLKYDAAYLPAKALLLGFGTRDKIVDPAVASAAGPFGGLADFFGKGHGGRRFALMVAGGGLVFIGLRMMLEVGAGQVLKSPAVKAAVKKVIPL